ncbi:flagellar biosynthetic protein FliO [Cellulosimicrobium sp. CUA-896]|uniref:FliO/MopB family protein n=1 Tax=Cellulosimicrobium sp. CUA-896 TaxID=1517881 RepID=UPI00096A695C|nr:flagellar biosynthetic protein FliO [Cellulosimicrobium sp. CUA-896]
MDLTTVVRVVFSLAVVFGLLWVSYRVAGRGTRSASAGRDEQLTVVARQGLTQKSAAVLLEAGGKRYLLGVTEGSVTVIDGPVRTGTVPSASASASTPAALAPGPARDTPGPGTPESFDDVVSAAERWLAEEAQRPHPWPELPPRHEAPTRAARTAAARSAATTGSTALETFLARDTWRRAAQAVLGGARR